MNRDEIARLDPNELMRLTIMTSEHASWLIINEELIALGYEEGWNDPNLKLLHSAVVLWGEGLALLREGQTEEQKSKALEEATTFRTKTVDEQDPLGSDEPDETFGNCDYCQKLKEVAQTDYGRICRGCLRQAEYDEMGVRSP